MLIPRILTRLVRRNQQSVFEVGHELMEIRDKGYYHDVLGYETFEACCKAKWDFSRSYAYRLIESAKVIDVLSPIGDIKPTTIGDIEPTTESQVRPLHHRSATYRLAEGRRNRPGW